MPWDSAAEREHKLPKQKETCSGSISLPRGKPRCSRDTLDMLATRQLGQQQDRNPGESRLLTADAHGAMCSSAPHRSLAQLLGSLLCEHHLWKPPVKQLIKTGRTGRGQSTRQRRGLLLWFLSTGALGGKAAPTLPSHVHTSVKTPDPPHHTQVSEALLHQLQ